MKTAATTLCLALVALTAACSTESDSLGRDESALTDREVADVSELVRAGEIALEELPFADAMRVRNLRADELGLATVQFGGSPVAKAKPVIIIDLGGGGGGGGGGPVGDCNAAELARAAYACGGADKVAACFTNLPGTTNTYSYMCVQN